MDHDRIIYLLNGWVEQRLSDAELEELTAFLANDANRELFVEAGSALFEATTERPEFSEDLLPYLQKTLAIDRLKTSGEETIELKPVRPVHFFQKAWFRYAAAIIILFGIGVYGWLQHVPKQEIAALKERDIQPGTNKAILTLGDGSTVALGSADHQVIQQGSTTISQQRGTLRYNTQGVATDLSYNTLTTPRGGQFNVRLPDGTQVWLNAASSLRYPTAFLGSERLVEVNGEAYFEVAGSASKPFKVKIGDRAVVEVLGTNFNVNAYSDESVIKTTLVDGKVQVRGDRDTKVLAPGWQAQLSMHQEIKVVKDADISQALAWKNGLFNFNGTQLKDVMAQLSRWYDIEVVYENGVPDVEFVGKINRNVNLSVLLKGLEGFDVHLRMENGRRIIVTR